MMCAAGTWTAAISPYTIPPLPSQCGSWPETIGPHIRMSLKTACLEQLSNRDDIHNEKGL